MDDHRFIRDFVVVADKQPCFDGIEVCVRVTDRDLGHQVALRARLGQPLERNRAGTVAGGNILPSSGNPAQKVFVVGNGMHA